jgi:predicted PurR-regulated permease PerM
MENSIKKFWPVSSETRALEIFKKIVDKISYWARGQLILSSSVGALVFIGLSVLHFEYALTMALVAAFMDLLPFIGPAITMTLGAILAFSISPAMALWVFLLLLGVQQFEGNILVPQIMKRATGLSPVLTIFSILIGARLLGFIGVIIAVPVASGIVVIIESLNKKGKA